MADFARSDDPDIKDIRDEFTDATDQWRDIREQGRIDMRYVSGDPWAPQERSAREDLKRPVLSPDETGQYVHQVVNDIRQNKRAIKVTPMGAGATDQTADARANLIRQIEYRSNAQQGYTTMFENAVQRSYGYLRVCPDYTGFKSFDQELRIKPCENPDMVTPDPYAVRTDGADWKFLYFAESWKTSDFKRKWPDAKAQSFGPEDMMIAPDWIKSDTRLLVAERWRILTDKRTLLLIEVPGQPEPITLFKDELEKQPPLPRGAKVVKDREVDHPRVQKQITNGLEILEETDFKSTTIPFVSCYGKVLYLDAGNGPEKRILSLVRLARDSQMLHAYIWSCLAEAVGAVPRNSWIGYEGQFSNPDNWARANREPVAYLEAKARTEETAGLEVLPLPQRQPWDPPIQNLLIAAEAARRSIQASMGITPLPTDAQRRNEKSGKALEQIEDSAQRGSFHFVDHYDEAITRTGAILDDWMPHHYDTARDVTVRKPDDKTDIIRVNDPQAPESIDLKAGQHDVTISVGPAFQSEREAASAFADTIINSPIIELLGPEKGAQIVALAIRLKSVGPLGDQMADIISPQKDQQGPTPEQAQAMQAQIQDLTGKLQQAAQEIQIDAAKQRAQIEIANITAQKDIALQHVKNAATIRVAEIAAQTKGVIAHREETHEALALGTEVVENEKDRDHEREMAEHQAEMAREQAEQEQAHALQQGEQGHIHRAEEGERGHEQSLEAGEQQIEGTIAAQKAKPQPKKAGE